MSEREDRDQAIAEAVQSACLEAAVEAWEQGGMSGLCLEGRWDLALDRLRSLEVESVIQGINHQPKSREPAEQ